MIDPVVVFLFLAHSKILMPWTFESFSHGSAVPEGETPRHRAPILPCHHLASRCNLDFDLPGQLPHPCVDRNPKVSNAGGQFDFNLSLLFCLGATGGTASQIPSVSGQVDENKPGNISSCVVDPTAVYENKPNWKSTVYTSGRLAVDVLKESSDAFTPLKSVVGGLSAVLKYYDVRYPCFTKTRHRSLLNQQTMANRETIESLIPRVEELAQSLSSPAPEGEIDEIERRKILRR